MNTTITKLQLGKENRRTRCRRNNEKSVGSELKRSSAVLQKDCAGWKEEATSLKGHKCTPVNK